MNKPAGDTNEILELYKLHAELADRVSQRREGANRLYVGLLTGVSILLAASLRFGTGGIPLWIIITAGGVLGAAIAVSWFIVIRSYRQLNTGKFAALDELESMLPFQFFRREWEILEKGENIKKYWKLTVVETIMPWGFCVFFLGLIVVSLYYTQKQ